MNRRFHKQLALLLCLVALLYVAACANTDTDNLSIESNTFESRNNSIELAPSEMSTPSVIVNPPDTGNQPGARKLPENIGAETLLLALTGEEFGGRGLGSEGNVKAGEYIANLLQQAGLKPFFEGSYYMDYEDTLLDPAAADAHVTVILNSGGETGLIAGEDYIHSLPYKAVDKEAALCEDAATCAAQELIFLSDDRPNVFAYTSDTTGIAVYLNSGNNPVTSPVTSAKETGVRIELISDRARELVRTEGASLRVRMNAAAIQGSAKNIAAYIPGTVGENAYIVLAHYDGSGRYGSLVFQSAYDNASGTATVLKTAMLFAQSGANLQNDVIFLFTNGEETGHDGAAAFVKQLSDRYKVINAINVDCVGYKGRDYVDVYALVDSETANLLATAMVEAMMSVNASMQPASFSGDSREFHVPGLGMLAVSIADLIDGGNGDMKLHTPGDTIDELDFERIEAVAGTLLEFLVANGNKIYQGKTNVESNEGNDWVDKWLNEQIENRERIIRENSVGDNEFFYYEDKTQGFIVYFGRRADTINELFQLYPELNTAQLGDFTISAIVPDNSWMFTGWKNVDNKLYYKRLSPGNVYPLTELDPASFTANLELILQSESITLDVLVSDGKTARYTAGDLHKDAAELFNDNAFKGITVAAYEGQYGSALYRDEAKGFIVIGVIADDYRVNEQYTFLPFSGEDMVHILHSIDFGALLEAVQQPVFGG